MKRILNFVLLTVIILPGLLLTSCDPKEPESEYEIVDVNDDITSATEWSSDKVYVIKKHDFEVRSELNIGAGTVIKFTSNAGNITVRNNGRIIARGSSSKPIVFTSYKDDSNGGDTNGDGGTTTPAVGDWTTITLIGSTGSEFTYCNFHYGGRGAIPTPTLKLDSDASANINNCTFSNNGGGPYCGDFGCRYYGALHIEDANVRQTRITNNKFYNNTLPLVMNAEMDIDDSNSFSQGSRRNTYNGIFLTGLFIQKNVSWAETEVAFVVTAKTLNVNMGYRLTLGNNVVLKFADRDGTLILLDGESALINHSGNGVWFTSFYDDDTSRKGDTNGDSGSRSPAEGDWNGIDLGGSKTGYADWNNILYNNPRAGAKKSS